MLLGVSPKGTATASAVLKRERVAKAATEMENFILEEFLIRYFADGCMNIGEIEVWFES